MNARFLFRRVCAALILFGFAIGSVLVWKRGDLDYVPLTINLGVACAGLCWLHFRWREKERRALTPSKVKDIFS